MNVLETFYYLFESDTRKLDDGLKKSERSTEGLKKSLDDVDKRAGALGSSLLEAVKGLGLTLAAGFSATAILAMTRNVSDAVDRIDDLATSLGVSASALDVWDSAAATTGGTLGGLSGSLRAFNERVHDLTRTGSPELLGMFERLGLSLDDVKAKSAQPLELLRDMADGVKELSDAEGAALGQKLGLDPGTVGLLRQGRIGLDEIIARQRELGHITDEQIEQNRKYREAQERLSRVWEDVRRRIAFSIIPVLERLAGFMEAGARLARDHAGVIKWAFGIIAIAAGTYLAPALLRAATASTALWTSLLRFAAIGAAFALVAVIAEDLYGYMTGADSVTGELVKKWPALGTAIRAVGNTLAWLIAVAAGVGSAFSTLFTDGPAAAFDAFRAAIRQIGADVEAQYPKLAGISDVLMGVAEQAMIPFRALVAVVEGTTATIAALFHEGPSAALRELGDWITSLGDRFPSLGAAASAVSDVMTRGLNNVLDLFARILSAIGRVVAALPGLGPLMGLAGRLFGGRTAAAAPPGLPQAQHHLAAVAASPVGPLSASAVAAGRTSNRTTSVQVDLVEVNTQATDADGIASGVGTALERELRSAADSYDDGVLA